jgi:hypothetical protein
MLPRTAVARWAGVAALLIAPVVMAAPARALEVILIRHADKDSQRGDYNLSPAGFLRAIALARLIPGCFWTPTGITTYVLDPDTSKNARSYQSAVPLAVATGVTIQIAMQSAEASEAIGRALRLRSDPSSRLVLFWEHRRMPDLARGLGWPTMPAIGAEDFDQLFLLRYGRSPAAPPDVQRFRQSALMRMPCFQKATLPWEPVPTSPQTLP